MLSAFGYCVAICCNMLGIIGLSPGQTMATCQHNISQHCWAQHVECVWPPCCDMLGVVGSNLTSFKLEKTAPNNMLQHIATRWPNARNMLHPTMLRSFGRGFKFETSQTTPNMSQHGGQTHAKCCAYNNVAQSAE